MSNVRDAECCGNCGNTTDKWGKMRDHVHCTTHDGTMTKTCVCDKFKSKEEKK